MKLDIIFKVTTLNIILKKCTLRDLTTMKIFKSKNFNISGLGEGSPEINKRLVQTINIYWKCSPLLM